MLFSDLQNIRYDMSYLSPQELVSDSCTKVTHKYGNSVFDHLDLIN